MTLIQAVMGLGCVAIFLAAIYGPWQWICTDIARQILFEKRDAVFDLAHSGKLRFSSPEYQAIRSSLQASIRFAHELTLPRFLVLLVVLIAHREVSQPSNLTRAIDQIGDPETRDEVRRLVHQATRTMLVMMITKSPIALALLLLLALIFSVIRSAREAAAVVERRAGEVVQVEAESAPMRDEVRVATAA